IEGLGPGDPLAAWRRRAPDGEVTAGGRLETPFTLLGVLRDQVPRDSVELQRREEWLPVPMHGYELRAEPRLPEEALVAFRAAVERIRSEDESERARGLEDLEELVSTAEEPSTRAWLGYRLALVREEAGDAEGAVADLRRAASTPGLRPLASAMLHHELGRALYESRRPQEALSAAETAARLLASADVEAPVLAAWIESDLGLHHLFLGDYAEAERRLTSALRSLGRHAPGSYQEGRAWNTAGIVASNRGDYSLAQQRYERAIEILREVGASVANNLNNLAVVAKQRGDLHRAETLYLQALELLHDDVRKQASVRGNLANLYRLRGELERARDVLIELVTFYRGEGAQAVFAFAVALTNLAETERGLGELAAAEEHVRAALAIKEERAPESLGTANTLNALGRILQLRERWPEARKAHSRALAVAEAVSPAGPLVAEAQAELGAVALGEGELQEAERRYRRALEMQRAIASGTVYEARWLHALGRIEELRGRPEAALPEYLDAVEVLEALRGRLGGAVEAGAGFTSLHHELYWRPIDLLASRGRAAEAFHLLERYRAQALLLMLANRDLDLSVDLPPELDRERRRLAALYDSTLQRLPWTAGEPGSEARRSLRQELDRIRREQRQMEDRIWLASPRLASIRDPEPLDAAATGSLLPPSTLLLSYAVGPERSWVFAVGPGEGEVRTAELPVGVAELGRRVTLYRGMLDQPRRRQGSLEVAGQSLTRQLLVPIADRLQAARHVVVLPDGPLHLLPWAVLPDPEAPADPLIARRSVSIAASATVLAELQRRRATAPQELVAFGDPGARPVEPLEAASAVAHRSGADLGPLPWSRTEVESVGRLFGEKAQIFLDDDVTEERLVSAGPTALRLHLACHAVVDPLLPLESGLVLARPAQGAATSNGFLQVWEIYQGLRLDAELVTLSACETALGRELTGEGVLGLTRAFHYAGARTVVSSLWKVSDQATALLMESFYGHLLKGQGKAEALRRAQLELLRGGTEAAADRSHPFYWAAFQVHGAWD
ncbi:MAG TPA: CHAT domain-containing protein, partial [Thermoanaerobaculia bacterium]|nr:CHAT domain-containing protein [Thermoanaerobaculia bacterium]